jgi:hypothetical protein
MLRRTICLTRLPKLDYYTCHMWRGVEERGDRLHETEVRSQESEYMTPDCDSVKGETVTGKEHYGGGKGTGRFDER